MFERHKNVDANPTSEQKIQLLNSCLYACHLDMSRNHKVKMNRDHQTIIVLEVVPFLLKKISNDYPAFKNGEGQIWLRNTLNSMIFSILSVQSTDDWLAVQLKPFVKALNHLTHENIISSIGFSIRLFKTTNKKLNRFFSEDTNIEALFESVSEKYEYPSELSHSTKEQGLSTLKTITEKRELPKLKL